MLTQRFDPASVTEESSNKRQKKSNDTDIPRNDSEIENSSLEKTKIDPKFQGVFERFKKSINDLPEDNDKSHDEIAAAEDEQAENNQEENIENLHGLEPLPIPGLGDLKNSKKRHRLRDFQLDESWIKDYKFISTEDKGPFESLNCLSDEMLKSLKAKYSEGAFPIQKAVIPEIMHGVKSISPDPLKDILVQAHTGSGKTVAYGVPIVEALRKVQSLPRLRALIIVPTNSLTGQIREVIEQLAKGTTINVAMLRTDRSFREEREVITRHVPHILVTTPGRMVDHLQSGSIHFERLQYLVIDEADRLLNQSFQSWVDVVMSNIPSPTHDQSENWCRPVQKLVFSATLTTDAGKLAPLKIHDPKLFILGDQEELEKGKEREYAVPTELEEYLVPVKSDGLKPLRLVQLFKDKDISHRVIVFVKDNETAARLARTIPLIEEEIYNNETTYSVERYSGEVEHNKRKKVLKDFKHGSVGIIVCTDMVSRGIDIENVEVVVNYDLPTTAKDYVHRVGRTARAGKIGSAWNLASSKEDHKKFKRISRKILRPGNSTDHINIEKIEENHENDEQEIEDGYNRALKRLEADVFNNHS